MGKRGPIAQPAKLKVLRGNPGKRPVATPPRGAPGTPKAPAHLPPEARAEWRRVTAELKASGLLTRADRAMLAAYCVAWARWVKAERALEEKGPVYETDAGNLAQSPWLWVANKALDQMRAFAALFGLSPAGRARLEAPPPDRSADPLGEWMGGKEAAQ